MGKKKAIKTLMADILFDIVGCFIFAISIQSFSAPNNMAPGGVSGAAILINYLFGAPISIVSLAFNIPLLILAWILLGKRFTLRTLKSVVIMTIMLELCTWLPTYSENVLLASIYAGVLQGFGLGLVFVRGSTTGGTDVAARLIQLLFPHVSMGNLFVAVDAIVLGASAFVYRNVESALYALIIIFIAGKVIDSMLYGLDMGKVMMIISDRQQEIMTGIQNQLDRGCTLLEGRGGYTSESRPVLLCAVRKQQFVSLKKLVRSIDPRAFMVALDATEIIGEGFKEELDSGS